MDCEISTRPRQIKFCSALILAAGVSASSISIASTPIDLASSSLADMSLEELSNIEITSVSRRSEKLSDAAASIFVITAEDIRRSGAISLPEALRLAPNLQVAQVNASAYAISARGFNNAIGNKLLVLIDGRTVYTPLYSGVNWDAQNVMLEDVERIEVISGPGATLWGANAVNGVINVITRSAQNTQGGLVAAGGGNRGSDGAVRYGGRIGDDGYYRVYGMSFTRDNTERTNGNRVADSWSNSQTGFRADWGNASQGFTLQGDTYNGEEEPSGAIAGGETIAGANLLARWNQEFADGSTFHLQAYYDYTKRDGRFTFRDETNIFDFEFQHGFALAGTHRILWGGGYRYAQNDTQRHVLLFIPSFLLTQELRPADRSLDWANLFLQDEVALRSGVNLTVGLKAESNVYTGVEWLPSVRLAWKPDADQLVWGALSHAVRAPARVDRDYYVSAVVVPGTVEAPLIKGGPDFESEVADVVEIGYRAQPSKAVFYSVTAFYSEYDKLRSGQSFPPAAFIQNMMEGTTKGIEAWGSYQATPEWRLSAGFTIMRERFKLKPGSTDPDKEGDAAKDPANTWMLRSSYNLTSRHDIDVTMRHVSPLSTPAPTPPAIPTPNVPQYTAVDARFAWRSEPAVELSLTLQNLFAPPHIEFNTANTGLGTPSVIDRTAYFKIRWSL